MHNLPAMAQIETSHLEVLADRYRCEAEMCREWSIVGDSSQKEAWLLLSLAWIKLAEEAEAGRRLH
jgi:hypothetical protein